MTDHPPSALADTREAHEPTPNPWSAAIAFCTAWLLPATTARRTAGLALGWAYLVHSIRSLTGSVVSQANSGASTNVFPVR